MPSDKKEVIIIGAGVTGCSIAFHLAKRGVPSTVYERDSIGNRASGKALALVPYPGDLIQFEILTNPNDIFYIPEGGFSSFIELFWEGYERMPEMSVQLKEEGGIDIGFGELTWVYVCISESEEKSFRDLWAKQISRGFRQSWWMDEAELKSIYPNINPKARGGLVLPNTQVEPYRYTLGLAQAGEKIGVDFRQGEMVGFKHKGRKVTSITLATGTEVTGDVFVMAMGPWNQIATEKLGNKIPIIINQDECLKLKPEKAFPPVALIGMSEIGCGQLIMPKTDGTVILGNASVPDPRPDYDNTLKEANKLRIMEGAIELMPSLADAKFIEHRGDLLHWSPGPYHWQPALGLLPPWDNVYVAVRMPLGITMSLGIGRSMADLIIGNGKPSPRYHAMMEALSPARLKK
jgi:glycine oxidase